MVELQQRMCIHVLPMPLAMCLSRDIRPATPAPCLPVPVPTKVPSVGCGTSLLPSSTAMVFDHGELIMETLAPTFAGHAMPMLQVMFISLGTLPIFQVLFLQ